MLYSDKKDRCERSFFLLTGDMIDKISNRGKSKMGVLLIISIIISIIITKKIGDILFANTFGSGKAYMARYMLIFFIVTVVVLFILSSLFGMA